jgi:hypothetical protein
MEIVSRGAPKVMETGTDRDDEERDTAVLAVGYCSRRREAGDLEQYVRSRKWSEDCVVFSSIGDEEIGIFRRYGRGKWRVDSDQGGARCDRTSGFLKNAGSVTLTITLPCKVEWRVEYSRLQSSPRAGCVVLIIREHVRDGQALFVHSRSGREALEQLVNVVEYIPGDDNLLEACLGKRPGQGARLASMVVSGVRFRRHLKCTAPGGKGTDKHLERCKCGLCAPVYWRLGYW